MTKIFLFIVLASFSLLGQEKPTVLILGNSINTESELYNDSSWTYLLAKLAKDKYTIKTLMNNESTTYHYLPSNCKSPETKPQPDKRYNITKALGYKPSILILSFTSNDVKNGVGVNEYFRNIDLIIKEAKKHHIHNVYITTPIKNHQLEIKEDSYFQKLVHITKKKYSRVIDFSNLTYNIEAGLVSNMNSDKNFQYHNVLNREAAKIVFEYICEENANSH
jgi:hypothetical protein